MEVNTILFFVIGALVIVILTGNAVIIRMRPNIGGDNSHERSGGGIFGFLFSIFVIIVILTFATDSGNWLPNAWNDLINAGDATGSEVRNTTSSTEEVGTLEEITAESSESTQGEIVDMPETTEQLHQQTENYGSGLGADSEKGNRSTTSTEGQLIYLIQKNAYSDWGNAFDYKTRLLEISSQVLLLEVAESIPYRVGFGPYYSEQAARAAQSRLGVGGTIKPYLSN